MAEEIIKINTNERGEVNVSARELYQALEVKKSYRFSQWFDTNSKQLIQNEDFTGVDTTTVVNNGAIQKIQDYTLTVDAAKQIAMMSGTDKGREVRMYFIQVENRYKQLAQNPSYQMALGLKASKLLLDQKEKLIAELKPKVLFADAVDASDNSVLVGQLAKMIKQNGIDIGQNKLFSWLRENSYVGKQGGQRNLPTQKSMELKIMETVTRTVNNPDGSVRVTHTAKITGKGQIYFVNKFLQNKESN